MTAKAASILKPPVPNFIPHCSRAVRSLPVLSFHNASDIKKFYDTALKAEVPIILKDTNIPALSRMPLFDSKKKIQRYAVFLRQWIGVTQSFEEKVKDISSIENFLYTGQSDFVSHEMLCQKLKEFKFTTVQYEYRSGGKSTEQRAKEISFLISKSKELAFQLPADIGDSQKEFHQFCAPLQLVFDKLDEESGDWVQSLYIAQMPIEELPPEMKKMFPPPMDIIGCGKGDIYGSSIWIGTPPTYTPLHKDPNPNIFTQYLESKIIRLLRPQIGTALFYNLQRKLGTNSSASFRGEEMMQGPEFDALEKSIWDNAELVRTGLEHYEAVVEPGESLFIPKGWWHSVKSVGEQLNMSVNWWFR